MGAWVANRRTLPLCACGFPRELLESCAMGPGARCIRDWATMHFSVLRSMRGLSLALAAALWALALSFTEQRIGMKCPRSTARKVK